MVAEVQGAFGTCLQRCQFTLFSSAASTTPMSSSSRSSSALRSVVTVAISCCSASASRGAITVFNCLFSFTNLSSCSCDKRSTFVISAFAATISASHVAICASSLASALFAASRSSVSCKCVTRCLLAKLRCLLSELRGGLTTRSSLTCDSRYSRWRQAHPHRCTPNRRHSEQCSLVRLDNDL